MPDEHNSDAEMLLESVAINGAVVPPLFKVEVGNALLIGVRRKRIPADFPGRAFDRIDKLPLQLDTQGAERIWTNCVELAAMHDLSLYDAVYLESAKRLQLPLATLDRHLAQAAGDAGVALPWVKP